MLADRLASVHRRHPVWRTAVAAGFTMLLVLAFALTGGISYAANAVQGGTTAVTSLVTGSPNSDKPAKPNKPEQANNGSSSTSSTSSSQSTQSTSASEDEEDDESSADNQYQEKVLICHIPPGNEDNPQTISVSENAVPAHLAHGDSLGACTED
jgi:cytoskeletal protein RodZ